MWVLIFHSFKCRSYIFREKWFFGHYYLACVFFLGYASGKKRPDLSFCLSRFKSTTCPAAHMIYFFQVSNLALYQNSLNISLGISNCTKKCSREEGSKNGSEAWDLAEKWGSHFCSIFLQMFLDLILITLNYKVNIHIKARAAQVHDRRQSCRKK